MIIIDEKELRKLGVDKKIITAAKEQMNEDVNTIKTEVDQNLVATLALANAVKDLATKPVGKSKPVDFTPVLEAIQNIQESQLNVLQLLEKKLEAPAAKPKTFDFKVIRNKQGSIDRITAKEMS